MGLTSRAGVVPVSSQQDSIGPISRHTKDAAIILSVISGHRIPFLFNPNNELLIHDIRT